MQTSNQEIIESLHNSRNEWISRLLTEQGLMSFLEEHYYTFVISAVKKEFLQRDLRDLQKSPLDLVHYSSLIRHVKETGSVKSMDGNDLFFSELNKLFKKYGFEY